MTDHSVLPVHPTRTSRKGRGPSAASPTAQPRIEPPPGAPADSAGADGIRSRCRRPGVLFILVTVGALSTLPCVRAETDAPALPPREPKACAVPGDDLAPTMVVVPRGRFLMGSPAVEAGRDSDEGPRHWVRVPRPFALSRCEITVGQFRRFVDERRYVTTAEKPESVGCSSWNERARVWLETDDANWWNPGFDQTDDHPVTCVSHADAVAYAQWLSQRTGAAYRLPTEAEWEYAARAGTDAARYWGQASPCEFANGAGREIRALTGSSAADDQCEDGFVYTAPVASFRPNAFQLYDMFGNVWEWTADCWHDRYDKAPADGSAWRGTDGGDCSLRVVRGGSWVSTPPLLRSALRGKFKADRAGAYQGFRVARDM